MGCRSILEFFGIMSERAASLMGLSASVHATACSQICCIKQRHGHGPKLSYAVLTNDNIKECSHLLRSQVPFSMETVPQMQRPAWKPYTKCSISSHHSVLGVSGGTQHGQHTSNACNFHQPRAVLQGCPDAVSIRWQIMHCRHQNDYGV